MLAKSVLTVYLILSHGCLQKKREKVVATGEGGGKKRVGRIVGWSRRVENKYENKTITSFSPHQTFLRSLF